MKKFIVVALFIVVLPAMADTIAEAEKQALDIFDKLAEASGEDAQALQLIERYEGNVQKLANSLELYEDPWNLELHQAIIEAIKSTVNECVGHFRSKICNIESI